MKRNLLLQLSAVVFAVFVLSSCAKLPQVEIDNANLAIQEAQAAGADIYVPEAFNALKDSMSATNESLEVSKSKLFKNFKKEKAQLEAIVVMGNDVKMKTETRISELKVEIQNTLTEVATLIEESKVLVGEAPRGKEGNVALVAIKTDIAAIEATLAEVTAAVGTESYVATLDKAIAVKNQATSIKTELQTVIEKFTAKKR